MFVGASTYLSYDVGFGARVVTGGVVGVVSAQEYPLQLPAGVTDADAGASLRFESELAWCYPRRDVAYVSAADGVRV